MAFLDDIKVTTAAATAAGTSTITSAALDMSGFDGALFVIRLGSPATNNNLRIQDCSTSGGTYADIAGTLVGNHATDSPLIVEVNRPNLGFLKWQVTRGTSTTIDTVTVIQYGAQGVRPVTQPSGTQAETYYHPNDGTA